ncbi:MAG: hypothetical protein D6720_03885 [Gammaproteobacteria bacterium]|nr:MAG: hypothetical protein D6720_03885 [Gammaproteobacteria bacterium]
MRIAIHQSQYLPWPPYFRKIALADEFVVMDAVQFQKNGMQNRNRIRNRDGGFWLTIPVTGRLSDTIREKRIADPRWRRRHWQSIRSSYGRAPEWERHAEGLAELYRRDYETLGEANAAFLAWFMRSLGIGTAAIPLSSLGVEGAKSDLVLAICKARGATEYLSGPGARGYLDEAAFARAGIRIRYLPSEPPVYPQCHGGFIAGLSMLDMLMNIGPEAIASFLWGDG